MGLKANESLLTDSSSSTTSTSVQTEVCLCEGSKCNSAITLRTYEAYTISFILTLMKILP